MNSLALAACLALATAFSLNANASSSDVFELTATSAEEFQQQANELRAKLTDGGTYDGLSNQEKSRVGLQLDALQELYDNRAAGKPFKRADEVKLVNASEEINGILTGTSDDRIYCEQVRKIGSNRTQKLCLSVAERRTRSEEAEKDLRNFYQGADAKREIQGSSASPAR